MIPLTNTTAQLPEPVAMYLKADSVKDLELLASCFAPEAQVRDENEEHLGVNKIIEWKRTAQEKYDYAVEPLQAAIEDSVVRVLGRVSGNFPGSPIELTYHFELESGKIARLEIE